MDATRRLKASFSKTFLEDVAAGATAAADVDEDGMDKVDDDATATAGDSDDDEDDEFCCNDETV